MKQFFAVIFLLGLTVASFAEAKIFLKAGIIDPANTRSLQMLMTPSDPGLYLVVWKDSVHDSERQKLAIAGVEVVHYIPDNAFLVKATAQDVAQLGDLTFVEAIVPFQPGFKLERELGVKAVFEFKEKVSVTVELAANADLKALKQIVGDSLVRLSPGRLDADMQLSRVWELAQRSDVLWIERRLALKIFDFKNFATNDGPDAYAEQPPAFTGFESGTKILNVDEAYAKGFHGEGMLTGYADTGLDKGEMATLIPDFAGQVAKATNIALYGSSWGDPNGHGTHVAGSIAGSGASSEGKIRGAAYAAKLVAQGMWSDMFDNILPPELPKIFTPSYADGARIHSNSWGASAQGRYDNFAAVTDKFMFENQDFLAIFAAGNDGADLNQDGVVDEGSLASPGSAKNVLTVGASKNLVTEGGIQKTMKELREGAKKWGVAPLADSKLSDDPVGMAAFSSRGPAADGRIKPDVVAPGTNVVSAKSTHPKATATNGAWGPDYVFLSGTSMATPVTSGAATLVRQYLVSRSKGASVSAALIKATMINTAEDLFPGQFGTRTTGQEQPTQRPNNHQGFGRVDLAKVFGDKVQLQFFDERTGLATDNEKSFDVKVKSAAKALRVTLAYTDAPGAAAAAKTLVNDLDLVVIDPKGNRVFPNRLAAKDSVNNVENIDISAPMVGIYKVSVKAANVPQGISGAQPYALVLTGGI